MKMSRSEEIMEKILKESKFNFVKPEEWKLVKVKIIECQSIIDRGYKELINKTFEVICSCNQRVAINYEEGIWINKGEYEFI